MRKLIRGCFTLMAELLSLILQRTKKPPVNQAWAMVMLSHLQESNLKTITICNYLAV